MLKGSCKLRSAMREMIDAVESTVAGVTRVTDAARIVRTHDDEAVILLRYDPAGNALPAWHWECDSGHGIDLVALDDGGAALTGVCSEPPGYRTVRFKADGEIAFEDLDFGATFSAVAAVEPGQDGSLLVATTPTVGGFLRPKVWKLRSDGTRAWTTEVPVTTEDPFRSSEIFRMLLAGNGDMIVAISQFITPMAVARIDGASGGLLWATAFPETGMTSDGSLAVAPNGRILAGARYFDPEIGNSRASITELTADGAVCRHQILGLGSFVRLAAGAQGWTVARLGRLDPEQESIGILAERFDADGPCDRADPIFANGFES